MARIGWFLYQAALATGLVVAAPYLLLRRGRHYLATLPGRLGFARGAALRNALWIHAVSVGEVGVAATLARALPEDLPLLLTTVTPTGQERARELIASGVLASRAATVAYLPFDLGFAVERFYRHYAPTALILVEGDYWPLVLRAAARREMPVAVVNARAGERSSRRLRRFPRLSRRLFFAPLAIFGVQSEEDRRRLIAAGAPPEKIRVTGNLKYDTPAPAPKPELERRIRRLAGGRPVLVAGSTMAGEEEALLAAFRRIGGGERALLVIAPRHPERWEQIADLVRDQRFELRRRSLADSGVSTACDVFLLDSLGELAALYGIADIAFIGGTLVSTGGHNPLEPAHFATPVSIGASMENFREIAEHFDRAQAWRRVRDASDLAGVWDDWLRDPPAARAVGARGAALLEANRGALDQTLNLLAPLIETVEDVASGRQPG